MKEELLVLCMVREKSFIGSRKHIECTKGTLSTLINRLALRFDRVIEPAALLLRRVTLLLFIR